MFYFRPTKKYCLTLIFGLNIDQEVLNIMFLKVSLKT